MYCSRRLREWRRSTFLDSGPIVRVGACGQGSAWKSVHTSFSRILLGMLFTSKYDELEAWKLFGVLKYVPRFRIFNYMERACVSAVPHLGWLKPVPHIVIAKMRPRVSCMGKFVVSKKIFVWASSCASSVKGIPRRRHNNYILPMPLDRRNGSEYGGFRMHWPVAGL